MNSTNLNISKGLSLTRNIQLKEDSVSIYNHIFSIYIYRKIIDPKLFKISQNHCRHY